MKELAKPLEKITKALHIHSLYDWYDVPRSQLKFACAGLNAFHQYPPSSLAPLPFFPSLSLPSLYSLASSYSS